MCALLILGTSSSLFSQEDVYVKVAKFSILVETSFDEIKLTCSEGCVWKELIFISSIFSVPQAIDQYGKTTFPRNSNYKESLHAKFLFTINRTQEGVSLEGKEGTMWKSLTFECAGDKCFRRIDGWGISEPKKK